MQCHLIHAAIDTQTISDLSPDALRHVQSCPQCQASLRSHRELADRLKLHAASMTAPAGLALRIKQALAAQPEPAPLPLLLQYRRALTGLASLAAAAAIVLAAWIVFHQNPTQPPAPTPIAVVQMQAPTTYHRQLAEDARAGGELMLALLPINPYPSDIDEADLQPSTAP